MWLDFFFKINFGSETRYAPEATGKQFSVWHTVSKNLDHLKYHRAHMRTLFVNYFAPDINRNVARGATRSGMPLMPMASPHL